MTCYYLLFLLDQVWLIWRAWFGVSAVEIIRLEDDYTLVRGALTYP